MKGGDKIYVPRLAKGEYQDCTFQVRVNDEASLKIEVKNFSYRSSMGRSECKPRNEFTVLVKKSVAVDSVILENGCHSFSHSGARGINTHSDLLFNRVSYEQLAHIIYLKEEKMVVNNVNLNFSGGSSVAGSITVGENNRVSYNNGASTREDQLRQKLEEVEALVAQLIERIELADKKIDVSDQLKGFVEEAKKEKPSKWMLDISSKGLIEAAGTVAVMAPKITSAVDAVRAMFPL
jgi:hypothetical protein